MKQICNTSFFVVALVFVITGCEKNQPYEIKKSDPIVHFISSDPYVSYFVRNVPADSFLIEVGTSDVSDVDRTVSFNITSPSGAVSGTDYSVIPAGSGNSVVIKAGTAISSIKVKGIFASYANGDKDTLVVTLAQPSIPAAKFNDTARLILQRYCDVNPAAFTGTYTKAFDTQTGSNPYGPYTIDIPSAVITSPGATNGYVMMSNFWDVGGPDIRVNIDWSDPANFITTVPAQFLYKDPNYGRATITGVGNGSFSSCDNTFKISYEVTVSAGTFGNFITTIAR